MSKFLKLIITTALLAVAGSAYAADSGGLHAFSPPPGDAAVDMLAQIFGSQVMSSIIGGGNGGGDGGALGAGMQVYNGAALFIGMLFLAYTTIRGTLDSAHDGVLLGKRMSSLWVPIRHVFSTAFLLPLSSGYSLVQILILWLAIQGVGVGDAVWSAVVTSLQGGGTLAPVSVPSARSLAASVLRSEVCMEAYNNQIKAGGSNDPLVRVVRSAQTLSNGGEINSGGVAGALSPAYGLSQLVSSTANSIYTVTTYAWASDAYAVNKNICGSISWTESAQSAMGAGDVNVAKKPILEAQARATERMIADLQPVAQQIVATGKLPAPGVLEQEAAAYEKTIQQAASQAVARGPESGRAIFESYAKDSGWVYAGAFYNSFLRYQDAVQSSVNTLPVSRPVTLDPAGEVTMRMLPGYGDFMNLTEAYIMDRSAQPDAAVEAETADASQIRTADDAWRLLSAPVLKIVGKTTQGIAGANTSPLLQLRSLGNDLVSAGVLVKGVQFSVAGLSGSRAADWTIGNGFNVSKAFETTYSSINWITNGLWVAGVILAYYLPAVPFIFWVSGVARWLVGVCEAVLAGPLLSVFMAAEGHDVVGRSGPGMLLLVSMVIQPSLLVFSLIFSMLIMNPLAHLFNAGFITMVAGITGSGFLGLFGFMAMCLLYAFIMVMLVHGSLALITVVPRNVMAWVASQAGAEGVVQPENTTRQLNALAVGGGQAGAVNLQSESGKDKSSPSDSRGGSRALNGISNADLINDGARD